MPVIDAGSDVMPGAPEIPAATGSNAADTTALSTPTMAEMVADLTPDNCAAKITELKRKAFEMRKERREVAKQLKNVQKKQRRLKEKARQLTDEDLLSVIMMRRGQKNAPAPGIPTVDTNECSRSDPPSSEASNGTSSNESRADPVV